MAERRSPDRRIWLWAFWFLGVAFGMLSFQERWLGPGFARNYAYDVVAPAFFYVIWHGLHDPAHAIDRLIGPSAEGTAACLLSVLYAAELAQLFNPMGLVPGTFDPLDFVAYAVGVGACYGLELLALRRRGARPAPVAPRT